MINNWDYHALHMDFSSMYEGKDHPSDIDMFYLCSDNTLIIGEIKNVMGTFNKGQRYLMERLIRQHNGDGVALYIIHNKRVQDGDKVVDVSRCQIQEMYLKKEGAWRFPKHATTVKEVIDYYRRRSEG